MPGTTTHAQEKDTAAFLSHLKQQADRALNHRLIDLVKDLNAFLKVLCCVIQGSPRKTRRYRSRTMSRFP
jgi:hypothetical protein